MSFPLILLIDAYKLKDFPKLLQEVIGDNDERLEMFQEKYIDLDEKDRWSCLRAAVKTCSERGIYEERGFYHVLFLQEVRGEEIDDQWEDMITEDCEEHEKDCRAISTQTDPVEIEEPKQEVVVPTVIPEDPPRPKNSRRYYCSDMTYYCYSCRLNLASDGSMHNHFKSKLHGKNLKKRCDLIRHAFKLDDKIIVDVRNKGRDPDLSWHVEEEEDLEKTLKDIEKYIDEKNKENPITHISLRRAFKKIKANGSEEINWNNVKIWD